jgi:hypothetical protein
MPGEAELAALVERFEAAAHEIEGECAAEALADLQADLQRLRPVLEGLGINFGE